MKQLEFKVQRNIFKVDEGDAFLDNGNCIQFMPKNKSKLPTKRKGLFQWTPSVQPKDIDWKRMKPLLTKMTYKEYTGHHPFGGADPNLFAYVLK